MSRAPGLLVLRGPRGLLVQLDPLVPLALLALLVRRGRPGRLARWALLGRLALALRASGRRGSATGRETSSSTWPPPPSPPLPS